jgi:hypothetical protein
MRKLGQAIKRFPLFRGSLKQKFARLLIQLLREPGDSYEQFQKYLLGFLLLARP